VADIWTKAHPEQEGDFPMRRDVTVRTSAPDYVLEAEALRIGPDILVYIWGGERPHIGAVAAAQPRPSLADANRTSATASVLCYVGHKEDGVAKEVAETLAARFDTNVVVTAGIHWDDLPADGIKTVLARCREITDALVQGLGGGER
jgi:hypothetical protein